jgi:hypothetical protein
MYYLDLIQIKSFIQFKEVGIKIADGYNLPQYYIDKLNQKQHLCYYFQSPQY